jgi:hypothetical protein
MAYRKEYTVLVENVDKENWRKFVALARYHGLKVGVLLNEIVEVYLERQKIRNNKRGVGLNG